MPEITEHTQAGTLRATRIRRVPLILTAVCGTATTMFMTITGILAGLPAIGADLGGSQRDLQWIADCYPLALASLLLPAGVLADRFGRRRLLVIGALTLITGLSCSAFANSPTMLLGGLTIAGTAFNAGYRHYIRGHLDPQSDRSPGRFSPPPQPARTP